MSTSFHRHVAIFGGSFNPPHRGHELAIQGLMKNPGVARVLVAPSFATPLKSVTTSYPDRLEMARLALSYLAEVSAIEEEERVNYTWQLLECLRGRLEHFAFVLGTDQFNALRAWGRFPELLKLSDWIVLLRKPDLSAHEETLKQFVSESILSASADPREWRITGSSRVLRFVETEAPEVSSTRIRENFSLNRSKENTQWVSKPVLEFIERNHLYGT
jgi:nicotinate-nucleotide adenylyltransferase